MANAFSIDDDRYEISKGAKSLARKAVKIASKKSGLSVKPVDNAARSVGSHARSAENYRQAGHAYSSRASDHLARGQDDLAEMSNRAARESYYEAGNHQIKGLAAEDKVVSRARKLRNNALTVGAVGGAGAGVAAGADLESRKRY